MDGQAGTLHFPFDTAPAPGGAVEVAEGILWLRLPLPIALDHVNVFALDDGDGWTLVDTGVDTPDQRGHWQMALSGPLAGKPVRRLLATHHHPDHIGLAGWFQAQGAELLTSRTSWLMARMLCLDVQEKPTPQMLDFWRGAGMPPDLLARRAAERPMNLSDRVAPLPLGYTRLREGDVFRAGGRDWDVRMGDGHAPEHVTLWSRDGDVVIGGDHLLGTITANVGVHPTEPEADPLAEWLAACHRMEPHATPDQLVLPGHKLPYRGLPLRLRQLTENHDHALDRLEALLAEPRTAADCFPVLFRRRIDDSLFGLAMVEAMAHVLHLWHAGRVRRWRREDGAWLWQALR